jgi:hypothetical protein
VSYSSVKKKILFGAVKVLKKFRMAIVLPYMRVYIDWKVDADVCTLKRSFLRILAVGSVEKTLDKAIQYYTKGGDISVTDIYIYIYIQKKNC